MKKFIKKHGVDVILCVSIIVIFASGFVVGRSTAKEAASVAEVETICNTERTEAQYTEITVTATAYCACSECCGKSDGITATGTQATAGRTIAVDPSVIPYGTEVVINGHTYVAEDCGGAIKGNTVDIFFDTHEEAVNFGRQTLTAYVMKEG